MDYYSDQQIYGIRHLSSDRIFVLARQYGYWLFLDEPLPEERVSKLTLTSLQRTVLSGIESDRLAARPTDPAPFVEWIESYVALGFFRTLYGIKKFFGSIVGGILAGAFLNFILVSLFSFPSVHALAAAFCIGWTVFELSQNVEKRCREYTVTQIRSYLRTNPTVSREEILEEIREETSRRLKKLKHLVSAGELDEQE
jgi:hypothetical protein